MENAEATDGFPAKAERELTREAAAVAKGAEQLIARISEQIRQQAERRADTALGEYEQKMRQIVAQTREELRSRSIKICERIRQAILLKAEQASTSLIDAVIAETGKRAGELAQRLKNTAGEEAEPVSAAAASKDDPGYAEQQDISRAEYKSARMAAEFEYRIESLGTQAEPEAASDSAEDRKCADPEAGDNTGQAAQEPPSDSDESDIEDFIRYLSQ